MSLGEARRCGVPEEKFVYLHAHADAHEELQGERENHAGGGVPEPRELVLLYWQGILTRVTIQSMSLWWGSRNPRVPVLGGGSDVGYRHTIPAWLLKREAQRLSSIHAT